MGILAKRQTEPETNRCGQRQTETDSDRQATRKISADQPKTNTAGIKLTFGAIPLCAFRPPVPARSTRPEARGLGGFIK